MAEHSIAEVRRHEQSFLKILLEWGGSNFLDESQSRFYAHMRAKFGRGPTAVSKKVPFNFISRFC